MRVQSIVANSKAVRGVLDTNILISACLKPLGLEAQTVKLAREGAFTLCASNEIWAEYNDVLFRPKFRMIEASATEMLADLRTRAMFFDVVTRLQVASDEDDNRLLECAAAAGASYLVTGNLKHFPVQWGSARIVNAREFLNAEFNAVIA